MNPFMGAEAGTPVPPSTSARYYYRRQIFSRNPIGLNETSGGLDGKNDAGAAAYTVATVSQWSKNCGIDMVRKFRGVSTFVERA
eukprot:COSAG05_NODE_9195_length_640_cov_1.611830_1_plen_84_part_00